MQAIVLDTVQPEVRSSIVDADRETQDLLRIRLLDATTLRKSCFFFHNNLFRSTRQLRVRRVFGPLAFLAPAVVSLFGK